ncbi:hypothetical protein BTH42_27225 [Burkholderia sp. SRS-W-2-2016]|uniref:hypothetical protein n=1 Tax=Burkholderia sp. SRS-W-2-2016 TaxID=1926878 RepID=UPI00094AFF7C|nr:hypothetical protein [Burkholderia sp. SRS-W-2-2016]OLL28459.1 hypothetical protein BTH42_27225 [Burkholderia sp. SRS-W-2-2016]
MATDLDDIELRRSTAESPDFDTDFYGSRATRPAPPRFGRLALCIAAATALTFGVMGTVAYSVWFNHDQQTYADAIASARAALGSSTAGQVRVATPPAVAAAQPTPSAGNLELAGRHENRTGRDAWAGQISQDAPGTTVSDTMTERPANNAANNTADSRPDQATGQPTDSTLAATTDNPPDSLASNSTSTADTTAYNTATSSSDPADAPTALDLYPPSPLNPSAANATNAANVAAAQQPANARPAKDPRLAQERRAAPSNAKHSTNLFARVGQFFRRASYRQHHSGRQQQDIYSHP